MQSYDTALKILLRNTRGLALRELTGGAQIAKWLNVELPAMQNLRVDLLGETIAGELIQIELQSSNDLQMALRMAEYCLAIYRIFGKFPRQLLLYVGKPEMRMGGALESAALQFRYELVDVRALDGRKLLDSSESVDVVLSVLTKFAGERESVHRIVSKLTSYPELERKDALQQLFTLAGLRTLEENIEEEVNRMPIDIDIREHRIIGRRWKRRIGGLYVS